MKVSRFFRYSLRTMFAVITIACILVGYWRYRVVQHRSAVELIRRAGATVEFDYEQEAIVNGLIQTAKQANTKQPQEPRPLSWHARLAKWHPDEFAYVCLVQFDKKHSPSEVEFAALRRFSRLEVLDVGGESYVSPTSYVGRPTSYGGRDLEQFLRHGTNVPNQSEDNMEILTAYVIAFCWAIVGSVAIGIGVIITLKIVTMSARELDVWELVKEGNLSIAIILAAVIISMGLVVSGAVHP